MSDYLYSLKRQMLVMELDRDIVDLKNKDEDLEFIEPFVAFQDLETQRVFIQEQDDFDEEFLLFEIEDIPMLQEWYDINDLAYQKLKKMVLELLKE